MDCLLGSREDADQVLQERGSSDPGTVITTITGVLWNCGIDCLVPLSPNAGWTEDQPRTQVSNTWVCVIRGNSRQLRVIMTQRQRLGQKVNLPILEKKGKFHWCCFIFKKRKCFWLNSWSQHKSNLKNLKIEKGYILQWHRDSQQTWESTVTATWSEIWRFYCSSQSPPRKT